MVCATRRQSQWRRRRCGCRGGTSKVFWIIMTICVHVEIRKAESGVINTMFNKTNVRRVVAAEYPKNPIHIKIKVDKGEWPCQVSEQRAVLARPNEDATTQTLMRLSGVCYEASVAVATPALRVPWRHVPDEPRGVVSDPLVVQCRVFEADVHHGRAPLASLARDCHELDPAESRGWWTAGRRRCVGFGARLSTQPRTVRLRRVRRISRR